MKTKNKSRELKNELSALLKETNNVCKKDYKRRRQRSQKIA